MILTPHILNLNIVKPHSANSANAENDDITLSRRGAFVLDDNSLLIRMPNSKSD